MSLAPRDPTVCGWGLQMYQPKWGGDPNHLWQFVQRIYGDPVLFTSLAADIVALMDVLAIDKAIRRPSPPADPLHGYIGSLYPAPTILRNR